MLKFKILLIALMFISCSTRKVEKSTLDVKKSTDKEFLTVDNKVSESKTETYNDVTTNDFVFEPVDTTKAIEIVASDGTVTKYKNARISKKKIVDKTKVVNDIIALESIQIKAFEKSNEVTKLSEKKSERTSWSWWWLLLLLIPVAYYCWQKFKDKIWFI